jgi:NitT/TauT family transport system substrate-binding protein
LLALAFSARPAAADDRLTVIGGAAGNFHDVLDFVAEGAGFFKAERLIVNKQNTGGAGTATQLVASGKADILSASIEPIVQGYEKGVRLQAFLSRDPRYNYVLGVLDDSPIRTLAGFKGANIGETNAGATAEIAAGDMLAGAGLKKADYAYVPIGVGAQGLAAIVARKVAGVAFPSVELGLDSVVGHVKFRIFHDPILDGIPNVAYMASPATIQSKADELRRYSRAIVKASLFIRYNPRASARFFLQGTGQKTTVQAVDTIAEEIAALQGDLPAADPSNERIGYIDPKGVALYCTFMAAAGLTAEVVPASAVVTDRFIAFANDFDRRAVIAFAKNMR